MFSCDGCYRSEPVVEHVFAVWRCTPERHPYAAKSGMEVSAGSGCPASAGARNARRASAGTSVQPAAAEARTGTPYSEVVKVKVRYAHDVVLNSTDVGREIAIMLESRSPCSIAKVRKGFRTASNNACSIEEFAPCGRPAAIRVPRVRIIRQRLPGDQYDGTSLVRRRGLGRNLGKVSSRGCDP